MEKDLIKKIKELKQIEPSSEWMNSTRHNLMTQIKIDENANMYNIGFFQWIKQPQSFALAFCLMIMFLGGPWLAIKASETSLPGEFLYSVKKATEGVKITVTSEDSKSQLSVEFAGRRLEELSKMSENIQDNDRMEEVASEIKNNLEEASIYADKISEANIIAVVKKANRIKDGLEENKGNMSSEAQTELVGAGKAVEEINRQILATLIRDKESGERLSTSTDQEILIFLEELEDGSVTTTEKRINQN